MLKAKNKTHRAYSVRKILDHTGAIFLCLVLLAVWQLYREPVSVPFLKPYVVKALNRDDSDYQVTVESVNLELVRSIKPIKIIANNVVYKKSDGNFVINAPKTSVSFSIRAILRGIIAPSSIEVQNPAVYVFTSYGLAEGGNHKKEEIASKQVAYYLKSFENFINRFKSADSSYPENYINDIAIRHAEVELHEVELGRKWTLSDLNYTFERSAEDIHTDLNALFRLRDKIASLGVEAAYKFNGNKLALDFYFSDLFPGDFVATFFNEETNSRLYHANLPLNGKISATVDFARVLENREDLLKNLDTSLEEVKFQFEGGQGDIMFSDNEEFKYDVSSFALEGTLDSGLNNLRIEDAGFDLGGQQAKLGFAVSGMKKYLLENSLEDLKLTIKAGLEKLAFDDLPKYWPKYVAPDAWEWCRESLYGGHAYNAEFTFDFAYDEEKKSVVFKELGGTALVDDSNLYYLEGMPHIRNVYGKVDFYSDRLVVDVQKGVSEGVIIHGGHVILYDLNKEDNFADIRLLGSSSITDALRLIDNEPLHYASEMGLEPDKVGGSAEIDLKLDFELKQELKPEEVKVNVVAELADIKIPEAIQGKPLEAEKLNLTVNNKGLLIEGKADFDGVGLDLLWSENFLAKNYKSKYKIAFKLDEEVKKKLSIDSAIINPPYIQGHAFINAEITTFDEHKTEVDITADLQNTEIDYSFLGFWKGLAEDANVKAKLSFVDGKVKDIPYFGLQKQDFELQGKIGLDDNENIRLVDVYRIKGPKNDAKARIDIAHTEEGRRQYKINVSGESYDLTEFFVKRENAEKESYARLVARNAEAEMEEDSWEKVDDTDISIAVNKLWTNEEISVRNFTGTAKLIKGIGIYEMHVLGNYGEKRDIKLTLDYVPRPNGEFMLSINSNNAGSTLKVLRAYENMRGGILQIQAKRNKDKEFVGHAKIRDFNIYNMPALAKLFTVASFSGMVDLLRGEGMVFSHFDAPFEYRKNTFYIKEMKTFGNVIGLTANGTYSRTREELNLNGVVIPAYGLNMMIGKIPVLGNLLAGRDGSVFAANYEMKGDISDPSIVINPLSALSPGSVKDMYNAVFTGE